MHKSAIEWCWRGVEFHSWQLQRRTDLNKYNTVTCQGKCVFFSFFLIWKEHMKWIAVKTMSFECKITKINIHSFNSVAFARMFCEWRNWILLFLQANNDVVVSQWSVLHLVFRMWPMWFGDKTFGPSYSRLFICSELEALLETPN